MTEVKYREDCRDPQPYHIYFDDGAKFPVNKITDSWFEGHSEELVEYLVFRLGAVPETDHTYKTAKVQIEIKFKEEVEVCKLWAEYRHTISQTSDERGGPIGFGTMGDAARTASR